MNLPIRQRAGYEPTHHFDSQALKQTGIDSPTFAELNRTYQYDKALNTIAANDEIESLKTIIMTKTGISADNIFKLMIIVTIMTIMDKLRLIIWIYTRKAINSIVLAMIITAMIKQVD